MSYANVFASCMLVMLVSATPKDVRGSGEEEGASAEGNAPDAARADTGVITGKVSFAAKSRLKAKDLINVVVSLENIALSDDELKAVLAARPKAILDQKDMTFRPHVLPILVGETVDFPNSDPLFHNVYSSSEAKAFNLGMYPQGQSKQEAFERPGIVELRCNVHSEMQAFVVVKNNPYFASVRSDGSFLIQNAPAGNHTIQAWHPKAGPITSEVNVEAGKSVEVNLELTRKSRRGGRR